MPIPDYQWIEQTCPICNSAPSQYLGRRGGSAHHSGAGIECHIWRCRKCDLIFPNPMPVPVGGVDQHYTLDPGTYFKHHDMEVKKQTAKSLLHQAEEIIGRKGRILDIGAGRGELLSVAKEEGWEPIGIEPSTPFAEYAKSHAGVEILQTPIEQCSFPSASFDAVILSAVLEHLYNPDETIAEISRVLRPGGALFVDVPNEMGLYFRIGNLYQKIRGRDWCINLSPTFEPFHVFGFTARSLRLIFAKHGLKIVRIRFYGGKFIFPEQKGRTLEVLAGKILTKISNWGRLGTYIDAWAVKE
jgi:SAM-dependent methyltransferase